MQHVRVHVYCLVTKLRVKKIGCHCLLTYSLDVSCQILTVTRNEEHIQESLIFCPDDNVIVKTECSTINANTISLRINGNHNSAVFVGDAMNSMVTGELADTWSAVRELNGTELALIAMGPGNVLINGSYIECNVRDLTEATVSTSDVNVTVIHQCKFVFMCFINM